MMGLIRFLFSKEYLPRVSFQMLEFQFPPTSFQTYTSNVTETPKMTKTSNLPYDVEFGDLTDGDVPDDDGQGCLRLLRSTFSLTNGLPKVQYRVTKVLGDTDYVDITMRVASSI